MSAQLESTHFDAGDEKVKFSDFFEFRKVLGNGSFGVVVSALQKPFMRECAVKIIMKKSLRSRNLEDLRKESQILQQLDHPNIVKFIAIHESDTRIFIVMELVRDGQLQALIRERNKAGKPFSDEEASKLMRSIFAGLRYIHSKDVVHRDLKPENILLNDHNDLSSVKICDFGLSAQYDYATCTRSFKEKCGTDIYMAPELWKKRTYGKPVDMWSCGIIMYLLLSGGKHPLHKSGDNHQTYMQKLEAAQWPMLPNFNRHSKDLFLKLVHSDPCERYTVEQMQDHPWITRRFHEDIPLTSSEKIAAFSHSQSLSQIIKSMYLMFALPNLPTTKLTEVPEESPQLENKLTVDTKHNKAGSNHSESTKSEEDISLKIPIIEEESPTSKVSQISPDESIIQLRKAPSSTTQDLSPTPTGLARKPLPSFSTQASTNPTLQSLTKKDRDHSAVGSLAELEITQASNQNSQQEEKNSRPTTNFLGPDLVLHTEPSRSDDPKRLSNGAKWVSERDTMASTFANSMKRRDLKSDKISEKVLPGHVKDGYSFDLSYKLDSSKSSNRLDKEEKKYLSINDLGYGQQGLVNSHTLGDLGNNMVTPTGQGTNKRRGEQNENVYEVLVTMSEKKPGEISRQQMLKRKIRKGASDNTVGSLPNVVKVKSRQASLPMKKKANPEKSVGRTQEVPQRPVNATGHGARLNMLPGDATPARNLYHEKRESSVKKMYDERKPGTAAPLEASRRTNSLLAACKTPQRDEKDEMPSLPLIKSETKKTKLGWMNNMDKGANIKTTSLFANMAGTIHRVPSKLVKAVAPFKVTKD